MQELRAELQQRRVGPNQNVVLKEVPPPSLVLQHAINLVAMTPLKITCMRGLDAYVRLSLKDRLIL